MRNPKNAESQSRTSQGTWLMLAHLQSVVACTAYGGLSIVRVCTRARYSPKIPRANSCAPEKIEIIEARNENPGTTPP